jgi:hypothetical protein
MENRITDLCFALDYWVFGGYVRDVMICGKKEFHDIDICVPRSKHSTVDNFLNALSVFYTIDVTRDTMIHDMKYGAMSKGIIAVIHVTVNDKLKLDIVLFDGSLSDWRAEHSVDASCNLFYTSRDTPLGIRYIPKKYKYLAAPARKLIDMTRNGIFETVYETRPDSSASHGESVAECKKVRHVMRRAKKLIDRGWFLKGDLLTPQMKEWSYMAGPVWESCLEAEQERIDSVQKDAQVDATGLPQSVRDEVRRKLDL